MRRLSQEEIDFAGKVVAGYFACVKDPTRVPMTRPFAVGKFEPGGGVDPGYCFEAWAAMRVEAAIAKWERSPTLRKAGINLLEQVFREGVDVRKYGNVAALLDREIQRMLGHIVDECAENPMPKEFERV